MADELHPFHHHAVECFASGLFTIYVTAHVTDDILRVLYKRKRIWLFSFWMAGPHTSIRRKRSPFFRFWVVLYA